MIDYFLKFTSRTAAKNDADVREHFDTLEDLFSGGYVLPDVKFWRQSQDVAGTDAEGNPTATHTYLTGWFLCVSLPRVVQRLVDHSAVQLVLDREKANARDKSAIIKSNVSLAVLKDLRWEPVPAGADYPWGFE